MAKLNIFLTVGQNLTRTMRKQFISEQLREKPLHDKDEYVNAIISRQVVSVKIE